MKLFLREGDFIETTDGLFFDVKGYSHPKKRIIAFLRYYPDENGDRYKNLTRYAKVYSLKARYKYLKENFPQYLYRDETINEIIQAVPINYVKKIYRPHEYLEATQKKAKKNPYEQKILEFVNYIIEYSKIFIFDIGVSGSPMIGLSTFDSDIDLIIYGIYNSQKVYDTLDKLFDSEKIPVKRYSEENLKDLYKFKSKDTSITWENFLNFEKKRKSQGKFLNTDFFIRFVRTWDEIEQDDRFKYGKYSYLTIGKATIEAKIISDDDYLFTPCSYKIDDIAFKDVIIYPELKVKITPDDIKRVKIDQIVSYRGRYTEGRKNEIVYAKGNLELVKSENEQYIRLIIGNDKEDYLYT